MDDALARRIEKILITTTIAGLGALALGIKVAEGINAWLKYQWNQEPIEPVVVDTQTNGGVRVVDETHRYTR